MFYINSEDVPKVHTELAKVIEALGDGAKKIERNISLGDDFPVLEVIGYWVVDTIRIDIKPIYKK